MCVHEPLKRIIFVVLSKVVSMPIDVIRDEIAMSIVATLIVVAVCIPATEIINRKIIYNENITHLKILFSLSWWS